MEKLDVVIVGAGIGGLETALALAQDGHKSIILDSVKEFTEVGKLGISIRRCRLICSRSVLGSEYHRTARA